MFILFLVVFFDFLGFGIILPMIPVFAHNYHLSTVSIGILASAFFMGNVIGAPLLGYISDKVGRKIILVISILLLTITYFLTGAIQLLTNSLVGIIILRAFSGFFSGNISISFAIASNMSTKDNLVKTLAIMGSGITMGIIFGPTIGGYLSNSYDSITPFYYTSIFYFICFLLALIFLKVPTYKDMDEHHGIDDSNIHPSIFKIFIQVIAKPEVILLLVLFILFNFAFTGLEVFLLTKTLAQSLQVSPFMLGLVWTYFAMLTTLAQLILAKRFSPHKAISLGLFIFAIFLFALAFANTLSSVLLCITFISLSVGVVYPHITANLSLTGTPRQQGSIFGINGAAQAMGGALGPYMLGYIYMLSNNSLASIWFSLAIMMAASAAMMTVYYRYNRNGRNGHAIDKSPN